MCILCKDWELGKLTSKEAFRNIGEILISANDKELDHLFELSNRILDSDLDIKTED